MKKNTSIHIKISEEEKENLKKKAGLCGLTLSSYIVFVLSTTTPKVQEISTS